MPLTIVKNKIFLEKKDIPSVQFSKGFNDFDFTLARRYALQMIILNSL